jgi:hypothetical protein
MKLKAAQDKGVFGSLCRDPPMSRPLDIADFSVKSLTDDAGKSRTSPDQQDPRRI